VHSDEAAAIAGKEHARCDSPCRSSRATGCCRRVLAQLHYLLEPELSAVEHQHPALASRALRLHTNSLQQGSNLVKLVLAEIGHGISPAGEWESATSERVLPWQAIRQVARSLKQLVMLSARKHTSNLLEEGTRPERLGEHGTGHIPLTDNAGDEQDGDRSGAIVGDFAVHLAELPLQARPRTLLIQRGRWSTQLSKFTESVAPPRPYGARSRH